MELIIAPARFLSALSLCLDFSNRGLNHHHQRVAYIVLNLAEEMGLSREEKILCFTSAIIHDAGVSTWREKKPLESFEVADPWEHCSRGYQLLSRVNFLKPAAEVILSHHDHRRGLNPSGRTGEEIPLAARLIHIADRLDISLQYERCMLDQREDALEKIKKLSGQAFDPAVHEKLNGQGYPFHLRNGQFSLPARIMAVSDIFTALREDRPYRRGLSRKKSGPARAKGKRLPGCKGGERLPGQLC